MSGYLNGAVSSTGPRSSRYGAASCTRSSTTPSCQQSPLSSPPPSFPSSLPLRFSIFQRIRVAAFELSASSATLIMVFAIQHTQGREQAATQRKLDELIRAFPGANESLMMLEEAPREFMLDVEDEQRDVRSNSPDTDHE